MGIVPTAAVVFSFSRMTRNTIRELLLHIIRVNACVASDDVEPLAMLAEIVVGEMNVDKRDPDIAIMLASQHLADIRSELIEASYREAPP